MSLPIEAVSEYTLYGDKSNARFVISRTGIKGNPASENLEYFGKWSVMAHKGDFSTAMWLLNPEGWNHENPRWVSGMERDHSDACKSKDFYFESADSALKNLKLVVSEDLIA